MARLFSVDEKLEKLDLVHCFTLSSRSMSFYPTNTNLLEGNISLCQTRVSFHDSGEKKDRLLVVAFEALHQKHCVHLTN